MKQVPVLLHRIDKFSLVNAVVVIFHVEDFNADYGADELIEELRDAVTKYARKTKEGRWLWDSSAGDLNIGDLASSGDLSAIAEYSHVIHKIEVMQPDIPDDHTYDSVLCDDIDEDAYA